MMVIFTYLFMMCQVVSAHSGTVTTGTLIDENIRMVNDVFLNTVAMGVLEFDSTQTADLQALANQCPLTHGSAVFRARSLLSLVANVVYDDDGLCTGSSSQGGGAAALKKPDSEYMLFPNPATNEVTMIGPSGTQGKIVIMNSLGEIMVEQKVLPDERKSTVRTDNIGNGLYLFIFYSNDEPLFTEKLIIVK